MESAVIESWNHTSFCEVLATAEGLSYRGYAHKPKALKNNDIFYAWLTSAWSVRKGNYATVI